MSGLIDIPKTPHWAILTQESITIPGDERSRTNPGHGYPEHTQTYISYQTFLIEADWLAEIEKLTLSSYSRSFRAIHVAPAEIKTRVEVNASLA